MTLTTRHDWVATLPGFEAAGREPSEQLLAQLTSELPTAAERMLAAQPPGHTIQATALVREATRAWLMMEIT